MPQRIALRVALAVGAFVLGALVLAAPSVISGALDTFGGGSSLADAANAVKAQDAETARRAFTDADERLGAAASKLGSIWTLPARAIPLVNTQIWAAHAIASSGALAARAGLATAEVLRLQPPGGWGLRDGVLDIDSLSRAGSVLNLAVPTAERARREIEDAPRRWLMPPLNVVRDEAERELLSAVGGIRKAAIGLTALPELLGAKGPRRYMVMNSNLSELRGTGGFLGYFTLLNADQGRLSLAESGRPDVVFPPLNEGSVRFSKEYEETWARLGGTKNWKSLNVSPDFPTVGDIAVQAASGPPGPIDGMMQVDPVGLSALLTLTGPVSVEGWPEPITAENLPRISQYEAYLRFGDDSVARDAFGEAVLRTVFEKLLSSTLPLGIASVEPLGSAAAEGHIKMYSKHPEAQKALERLDIDGGLGHTVGATDVLSVFNQNGSGNKLDWFLHREIRYDMRVDPYTGSAETHVSITLHNDAPTSGLPKIVIGPNDTGIAAGENQTIIGILRPRGSKLLRLTVDGETQHGIKDTEKHLDIFQFIVSVDAGADVRITADFEVPNVVRDGKIDLRTINQPIANPGRFAVRVTAPWGWQVDGGDYDNPSVTTDLDRTMRVHRAPWGWVLAPLDIVGRAVLRLF